jgi:hypothetical protein
VLERAAALGEAGAGVALARNGVASLHGLGLDDGAIASIGTLTRARGTLDQHGRPILPLGEDVEGVTMRGVHRARLHGALLERVRGQGVDLVTGVEVTGVVPGAPGGGRRRPRDRARRLRRRPPAPLPSDRALGTGLGPRRLTPRPGAPGRPQRAHAVDPEPRDLARRGCRDGLGTAGCEAPSGHLVQGLSIGAVK